jgi:hypothetical protein
MAIAANDTTRHRAATADTRVAGEMAHAAMLEFLGMEQSLEAAARHLAAAEAIDRTAGDSTPGGLAELAAIAARGTLAR